MNDTEWLNAIEKYKWVITYNHTTNNKFVIRAYADAQFTVEHKTLRAALHLAYLKQLAWEQKNADT